MNPLIFIMVIFAIDLVLKSSKDKKKIQEARRKREEQLGKTSKSPASKKTAEKQSLRDRIFEATETRYDERILSSKERREAKKETLKPKAVKYDDPRMHSKEHRQRDWDSDIKDYKFDDRGLDSKDYKPFADKKVRVEREDYGSKWDEVGDEKSKRLPANINLREDLLKGVIFTEILGKPKSMQNRKKSM